MICGPVQFFLFIVMTKQLSESFFISVEANTSKCCLKIISSTLSESEQSFVSNDSETNFISEAEIEQDRQRALYSLDTS